MPDSNKPDSYKNDAHEEELLSHNYDGIQEYDNPIPGWWHMIFLGSWALPNKPKAITRMPIKMLAVK